MSAPTRVQVEARLAEYIDPFLGLDLITAKVVKSLEIKTNEIIVDLVFAYPLEGYKATLLSELHSLLSSIAGSLKMTIQISTKIEAHVGQQGLKGVAQIKNIIPVASGKGGVGKSTVSVNLALALAKEGAQVGILDADIYGPSQPMMLGAMQPPEIAEYKEKKILLPIRRHGIQSMSIGYLIDQSAPMVWRGPMVTTALQQLFNDTQWDSLDYLIIDLPPGTGDIQLTLAQKIPVSAAVVVTTPQDLALLDARRAYEMFRKVNIPVLGVIENMSLHICSKCHHAEPIFGEGGGAKLANEYEIDLLGSLPLDMQIRQHTDAGIPSVAMDSESSISLLYRAIARQIAAKLSLQKKDYSSRFPTIVIKND